MKKFFWIAIAVILLLLGVLVWQIRGSRTMNDPQILTKLVAEPIIYDSDGLVDFASMLNVRSARDVQPEENAFIDYARILGPLNRSDAEQIELCKLLQVDSLESPQPYVGVSAALGPNGPGNEPQAWDQVVLRPWTNEAFPNHAKWLEQNAGHVVAIHAAARKPKYFYPLQPRIDPGSNGCRVMNCTLEYTQQMRELARLLSAHAMNLVGRGELRSAFQDLESIHRMAAQVGQGPFLIEKMVAIAIDGYAFAAAPALLESPQLTPADLSDYRRFLRDNPLELQVAESLATAERLASLDAVQSIEKWGVGVLSGDFRGRSDSPISDRKLTWTKLDWSVVASIVSRSFDGLAATIRQPDELVRLRETKAAEQELVPPPKSAVEMLGLAFSGPQARGEVVGQTLASQLMPATSQVVAAEIRARTRREMLDLALAIAEYRLDTGRLPETLDALVPAQIAAVPPDRFTQQALIYRVFEDGFELISVGQDGRFDDDPLPNSTQDICFIVRPIQILNPAIPVEAPVQ